MDNLNPRPILQQANRFQQTIIGARIISIILISVPRLNSYKIGYKWWYQTFYNRCIATYHMLFIDIGFVILCNDWIINFIRKQINNYQVHWNFTINIITKQVTWSKKKKNKMSQVHPIHIVSVGTMNRFSMCFRVENMNSKENIPGDRMQWINISRHRTWCWLAANQQLTH